jgi:hypothetical protein
MTKIIKLPGFPTEIGEEIQVPNMGYLLTNPMFDMCPLEEFMKRASNYQKLLFSKAPLRRTKKNIIVTSRVQMLFPSYSPTLNRHGFTHEWHTDGASNVRDRYSPQFGDIFHLFMSDCTSRTEFATNELEIDLDSADFRDIQGFNKYFNAGNVDLKGKKAPAKRFVTFSNHLHRPTDPERPEFRFFFHIIESDSMEPFTDKKKIFPTQSSIFKATDTIPNVEHCENGNIEIFIPEGEYGRVLENGK